MGEDWIDECRMFLVLNDTKLYWFGLLNAFMHEMLTLFIKKGLSKTRDLINIKNHMRSK